jgi:hypothetical protein
LKEEGSEVGCFHVPQGKCPEVFPQVPGPPLLTRITPCPEFGCNPTATAAEVPPGLMATELKNAEDEEGEEDELLLVPVGIPEPAGGGILRQPANRTAPKISDKKEMTIFFTIPLRELNFLNQFFLNHGIPFLISF